MVNIPIELFGGFIGISLFLVIVGFLTNPRMPILLFIAGVFVFTQVAITENLVMGYSEERSVLVAQLTVDDQTSITHMNVTTGDTFGQMGITATNSIFRGEELGGSSSLIGDEFNHVRVNLTKTGNPAGSFYVGVWNPSLGAPTDANYECLVTTVLASTLTTTNTRYDFEKTDGTCTLSSGDAVGIFYNSGTSGNIISIFLDTTSPPFDGTNSYSGFYAGGIWQDNTAHDVTMQIYYEFAQSPVTTYSYDTVGSSPLLFEFSELPKALYAIYGVTLMLIGVVIFSKER